MQQRQALSEQLEVCRLRGETLEHLIGRLNRLWSKQALEEKIAEAKPKPQNFRSLNNAA